MKITDIERILLDVPFHPVPQHNMERANNGWHIVEICRVTTDNNLIGIGETLPNYTWCRVTDESVDRAQGGNPFELMWDDTLGAGLQMALFDVAAKAAEVPVHCLMGHQHRNACPISWWGIDMPPEDFAAEAESAARQGYCSFKQKARPWFDVFEQVRMTSERVDRNFKLDLDFNEHLGNSGNAAAVLNKLDRCPNVAIYEEPINRDDVDGNRVLRQQTRCSIALHYQQKPIVTNVREEMCDGYVVSAGASQSLRAAKLCGEINKLMWLQLVGTGITTAWAMHLGAVCAAAQWPAVTCMNMYVDSLINEPMPIIGGFIAVPEPPGLGVTINESALAYRVNSSDKPNADAIYAIERERGSRIWFPREIGQFGYWTESWAGNLPPYEEGSRLKRWDNDGSRDWQALAERLKNGPIRE